MARIRTIKPEFWTHEDLSALPEATHILAAALLNHADDEGFFNAHPGLVKAACSPLREPSVSIQDSLVSLHRIGFISLGNGADGKRYGRIAKFESHQVVNRPTPSKIKAIQIVWEDSPSAHGILSESSVPERNREGNREQGTGKGSATIVAMPSSAKARKRRPEQTPMPDDFGISERVRDWAVQKGFTRLDEHLDAFRRKVSAKGYVYANWDDAFMEAVREDWAKLRAFRGTGDLLGSDKPRTARRLGSDQ